MENWNSEWTNCPDDDTDSKDIVSEIPASCVQDGISEDPKSIDLFTKGNVTNSPTVSMDSSENLDDELHSKVEYPLLKTSIINASLAKRRLQAYSKQVRKSPVKEEKNDDSKHQKEPVKKTKKDLYPGEKAKAVIQEIEDIKKKEFEDTCKRLAVADAIRTFHSRQISDSPDRSQQFKRREIKQRNYRRTDSFSRKSPTPEDVRAKNRYSPSHKYPKDWTEYKKQKSIPKDSRGRYFQKKGFSLSLLEKLYNFDVPSPLVVPCRIEMETGIKEIPLHSIKVTKSRPSIIHSVNTDKLKDSFPSRNHLYDFISKERQKCIKDVISKHVKALPVAKKMMSQSWYNKQWRTSSFTECKVLEKSVGLSFLQNYSDEEDDVETEEIIICSNTKKNTVEIPVIGHFEHEPARASARNPLEEFSIKETGFEKFEQDSIMKNFSDSKSEVSVFTPERNTIDSATVANSALEDESGILTPDISALQLLKIQNNTPKSVENERINKDTKSDLKKKKKKRKLEIEQSEDDSPKKKKKRKSRSKKSSSSDGNDASCNGKKKKKKPKPKEKRNKKKKADVAEERLKKKERNITKKRTNTKTKSFSEDVKKKPKKKIKKQEERDNKESSNKKEPVSGKLLKQKRVESKESDNDLTQKYKEQHKNDEIEKSKLLKKQKIKKEFALNEVSEKHLPIIDVLIKKEPEDDSLLKASTNLVEAGAVTPDTLDYSGNWEKDDPSWESEEENVPKEKLKLNTSSCWESDEELYENRLPESRPVEKSINTNEMRDLEIPLNIKPFKKREIQIIKKDIFNIDVASKEEKLEYPIILEKQIIKETEKRRRWDKKEADPKIEQIIGEINKAETTYTVLENEYEEFMKAVSSNTNSSPACEKQNTSIISISSTDSKNSLEIIEDETKKKSQIIIAPNDIPFIPMPEDFKLQPMPEDFKLQPVPEDFKLQPIPEDFKLQPIPEDFKLQPIPEDFKLQPVPEDFKLQPMPVDFKQQSMREDFKLQPVPEDFKLQPVPEDFKLQPLPEVFKLQPLPEDFKLQPLPEDFKLQPLPEDFKLQPVPSPNAVNTPQQLIEFDLSPKTSTPVPDLVTTSLLTDKTKSFSFTTLMLPSKKVLIDNSNLKLGDSDDETPTVMKPIEDVKRELSTYSHKTEQKKPVTELAVEKNVEIKQVDDNSELERSKMKVYSTAGSEKHQLVDKPENKVGSHKKDSQLSKHRRASPRRRTYSPSPREYSPRRRRKSPERYKSRSPASRRYHSRRNYSPHRRRTPSPRRRSPKRSASPRDRMNKKISTRLDDKREKEKVIVETKNVLSSPLEGPKRSVADSTISDDSLLPQPNLEEYTHSPVSYYVGRMKSDERKRLTLDERINLELGYHKDEFKPISTTYDNFSHNRFTNNSQIESCTMDKNVFNENISSSFVQLGNMVEIVPTDLNLKTDLHLGNIQPKNKSGILQVGNVLQIVPTELLPEPPPLPPVPPVVPSTDEIVTNLTVTPVTPDKQSAELNMKQKIDERKAEREKRKLDREAKRREKESRRREKEKRRQVKMTQKTENMIKKALQLEVENQDEEGDADLPAQWPPIHVSGTPKEIVSRRSILLKYGRRSSKTRKKVQFADGIKPGEGTSPSAGEDLTSPPPPSKVLPKEKRYTKTKLGTKNAKKKVKVKIIKPGETLFDDSEEEDNLPPPSPPPGSPPPHLFPPRIKPQVVANHGYVPNVITQSSTAYRPVNLLMMQPPLPDSPMQIHSYAQYQVPPLPPSASSLPPGGTESAAVPVHRNHFNYPL